MFSKNALMGENKRLVCTFKDVQSVINILLVVLWLHGHFLLLLTAVQSCVLQHWSGKQKLQN